MGVQLGVTGAAGAVTEPGRNEPDAGQATGTRTRSNGAAWLARLFDPRRTKQASRSSHATASSTAWSRASTIWPRTNGSANAYITDTDFGAENVRSNPGTRHFQGRIWVAVR